MVHSSLVVRVSILFLRSKRSKALTPDLAARTIRLPSGLACEVHGVPWLGSRVREPEANPKHVLADRL